MNIQKIQALISKMQKLCRDFKNDSAAFSIADTKAADVKPADLNLYIDDDYSRVGCTLVIRLSEDKWDMSVYAPGYAPVGSLGMIGCYFARPYGSTGIGIDAYIQRGGWRHVLPEMIKAERAYAAASGSAVTT